MRIKDKPIININNVHSIEPFFMRYLSIIIALILTILFIFIFGTNKINAEYNIINVWSKSTLSTDPPSHDENIKIEGNFEQNFAVKQGSFIHYFDNNGNTIYYKKLENEEYASLNNRNYILYKRYGRENEAYSYKGEILWRTNTSVYPEVAAYYPRIINHSSDNAKIQMMDFNNNPLSPHIQYGETITDGAFAKNTGDYISGFSSGYIAYINRNGKLEFAISTILSEINIVKSVAISEYGSFVMSLSGIRPEYLTLYNASGNTMWYVDTGLNRRRNVSIYVSERSMLSFLLSDRNIQLFSLSSGKKFDEINIEKYNMQNAVYMKLDSETNTTIFAVAKDAKSDVFIYDNKVKEIIFDKSLDSWVYYVDISSLQDEYMIVSENYIYAYKRVKL